MHAVLTSCGAGHHAGDVGPPPAWGGIGDDIYGPCASAGMFGCAPVNSTNDYFRDGDPHVRARACTACCAGDVPWESKTECLADIWAFCLLQAGPPVVFAVQPVQIM
jgi:hypothetical protein